MIRSSCRTSSVFVQRAIRRYNKNNSFGNRCRHQYNYYHSNTTRNGASIGCNGMLGLAETCNYWKKRHQERKCNNHHHVIFHNNATTMSLLMNHCYSTTISVQKADMPSRSSSSSSGGSGSRRYVVSEKFKEDIRIKGQQIKEDVQLKGQQMKKDGTKLAKEGAQKVKDGAVGFGSMMKQYGGVFLGTYLSVYVATLTGLYIGVDTGVLDPISWGVLGSGTEDKTAAIVVSDFLKHYTWTENYAVYVQDHPHVANFLLAWLTTKTTEPVRLGSSIAITPKIAKSFGYVNNNQDDDDAAAANDDDDSSSLEEENSEKKKMVSEQHQEGQEEKSK